MVNRRGAVAVAAAVALLGSVSAFAGQDKKKQDDAQKKEVQAVVKLVDAAMAGQPMPNDLGLAWVHQDFLKAQGNKEYVPFIVTLDASKVAAGDVAFHWRAVATGAPAAAATNDDKDKKDKKDKDKKGKWAYEDVSFAPATAGQTGPMQFDRSFTVPGGTYDVYVVAQEMGSRDKNAPPPKTSILKQQVTVPDFWDGELGTSSVIVAQKINPLAAPLTPEQQADRPYAMGPMEIVPALTMTFTKKQELSTFMLIYNPKTDGSNKPDVQVEYNFYAKNADGEKFFNKTNPQALNATTLPPQFDLAAGHQLQSGQAVPLATFPEGDYRLEIKVTDKIANKSLTRDVNFSVSGT